MYGSCPQGGRREISMFGKKVGGEKEMGVDHTYYLSRADPWVARVICQFISNFPHEIGSHHSQGAPRVLSRMTDPHHYFISNIFPGHTYSLSAVFKDAPIHTFYPEFPPPPNGDKFLPRIQLESSYLILIMIKKNSEMKYKIKRKKEMIRRFL